VWFEGAVDVHGEWMVVAVSVTVRGGVRRGAGEGTIGSRSRLCAAGVSYNS